MTRAFVALRLPDDVLDAVEARAPRAGAVSPVGGRVTSREQWHVTLQFLGDHADIDTVADTLAHEPFEIGPGELRLGGAAALGNPRRARIVALVLHKGTEWMKELAAQVDRRLARLGFVRDDREFLPHLTIARFREPTDLRPMCAAIGTEPVGDAWVVDEVVLFESRLHPNGARHVSRAIFPLDA